MTKFTNFMLLPMAIALVTAASACDTATGDDDSDESGGSAGSAGSGKGGTAGSGTGGTSGGSGDNVVLQPDGTGWMDRMSTDWNSLEINGAWYPYGDQYGDAKCTVVGMHT